MCTPREMVCARVQHLEVTAKQGMQHPALLRLLHKNGTSDSSMVHRYDIRDKHLRFRWPLLAFANALTTARDKGGASTSTHIRTVCCVHLVKAEAGRRGHAHKHKYGWLCRAVGCGVSGHYGHSGAESPRAHGGSRCTVRRRSARLELAAGIQHPEVLPRSHEVGPE